jgi:phosphatidylserine/phosphatidylglycerophosphate/cardiolipin synthase-like enzyme
MSKFLDTTGVSYHLQQLINNANERLILISPYLQLNDRIKQSLEDRDRLKIDIRLVYGKSELHPEEIEWLRDLTSIRTSFCKNLHAKCYLSESEAILTSMNLYEFSEVNNNEMGIHITRAEDTTVYDPLYEEVMRLIRISDEVQISVSKVGKKEKKPVPSTKKKQVVSSGKGHCIRCDTSVTLNPAIPYCKKCFSSWAKYKNSDFKEKHCHICGTENQSTLTKPVCYQCFKKHKKEFDFSSK